MYGGDLDTDISLNACVEVLYVKNDHRYWPIHLAFMLPFSTLSNIRVKQSLCIQHYTVLADEYRNNPVFETFQILSIHHFWYNKGKAAVANASTSAVSTFSNPYRTFLTLISSQLCYQPASENKVNKQMCPCGGSLSVNTNQSIHTGPLLKKVCVLLCVCVWDQERETDSVCVCLCVFELGMDKGGRVNLWPLVCTDDSIDLVKIIWRSGYVVSGLPWC